jgi:hypothetical protein
MTSDSYAVRFMVAVAIEFIMLSVVILSVVILSVALSNVVASKKFNFQTFGQKPHGPVLEIFLRS